MKKIIYFLSFLVIPGLMNAQQLSADLWQRYHALLPNPEPDLALRQVSRIGQLYKITDKYTDGALASIRYAKEVPVGRSFHEAGSVSVFYKDGKLKESRDQEGKGYRVKEFFTTGQIFREYLIQEGEKEMIAVFDPDGNPLVTGGAGKSVEMFCHGEIAIIENGNYEAGKRNGEWLGYTDKPFFREVYKEGRLILGESWDAGGRKITYKMREEPASFKGGDKKLFAFLAQNLRIPPDMDGKFVRVLTQMEIDSTGKVVDVQLLREAPAPAAAEALRAVKATDGHWLPGKLCGQPVSVFYIQAVVFSVR